MIAFTIIITIISS